MKEKQAQQKENNLEILIWFLPVLTFPVLTDFIETDIPILALKVLLSLLGGAIGTSLFWITRDKSKSVKYITFGLLVAGLIGTFVFFANKVDTESLITCQICGYQAIEKPGGGCSVCLVEINEEYAKSEGYLSVEEMIKEEQLFFFALEDNVTFTEPSVFKDLDQSFKKDTDWQPIVTLEDVLQRKKEMNEIGK